MRIVNKFIHEYSMSTVSYIYIIYVYVKCEKNSMILIVWNIFLYCTFIDHPHPSRLYDEHDIVKKSKMFEDEENECRLTFDAAQTKT